MIKTFSLTGLLFFVVTISSAQTNLTNLGVNSGTQGNNNSFYGFRSGQITTENNNSFFGAFSGLVNTIGKSNSFFGVNSGRNNIQGNNNTFMGVNSGRENTIGLSNSFFGVNSGRNNIDGNNNTFVGSNAGTANTTGVSNSYFGSGAGASLVTGNNNVFVGRFSGNENTGGLRNVFIGAFAGRTNQGNANVFIGYEAGANELGSNMFYVENSNANATSPLMYGKFNTGQLGVNTTTIPTGMTFAVGGNTIVDGDLFSNRISIGTTEEDPGYDFTVKGKIHVQEVKVDLLGVLAPDYVFYENYELKTLKEVEEYISTNGHLPNIPSAEEMEENGVNLKEMNLKLLEKIEELTLYNIQQQKLLEKQEKVNSDLESRLAKLEAILLKK